MTEDQPATPRPSGHRPGVVPLHRSVADGELKGAWTLSDYFASLDTVMRIPSQARQKRPAGRPQATADGGAPGRARRGWVGTLLLVAGAAVVIIVGGGALLALARSGPRELRPALGVWEAGEGPYAGRSFELRPESIAFRSGWAPADSTRYRITGARGRSAGDSTLYTVLYDEQGRESEFSFWYVDGAQPVIRLRNRPSVTWYRSSRAAAVSPAP